MSSKFKTSLLLVALVSVISILFYLLKDVTAGNSNGQKSSIYDANYFNDLGNKLIMKEKFNEAIINFNKAIEISKNTPQFYVPYSGKAIAEYNLTDCNAALKDSRVALSGDPNIGNMYSVIGICEFINSNYNEANTNNNNNR